MPTIDTAPGTWLDTINQVFKISTWPDNDILQNRPLFRKSNVSVGVRTRNVMPVRP